MKKVIYAAAALLALAACQDGKRAWMSPAIPRDAEIEARVEKVLRGMSLEEKAGQMVQLSILTLEDDTHEALDPEKLELILGRYKVGSILNILHDRAHSRAETAGMIRQIQEKSLELIGIPCIYGLDMIHGASYLTDGTFFPQEINLAATFDRSHAARMGEAMAYETRAAMVPWVFSPVMDLGRDVRWSRLWESWGEDPYLSAEMAVAETRALQGADPNRIDREHVAVSIKHYMAYGVPHSGKDRTPAYVPENDLRERYFRPFKDCFRAGALTAMVNSASINGVPMHANRRLLTGWAKEELNWDGMLVTDWADIDNLYLRDHVAADKKEAIALGINAGIDMIMDPFDPECCTQICELVREGRIPMTRIDDAVRRVLRLKFRLGLFDAPVWDVSGYERFGCEDFRQAAYAAAVESEVLLKNAGGLLPLARGTRLLVTGPNAHSVRTLNGGWSYTWQGFGADAFSPQTHTILEAMQEKFGRDRVTYVPGVSYAEVPMAWELEETPDIGAAVAAARHCDVIVCCVGENSYCETPGNMNDLNLSANQKDLVRALAKTGKPLVLVLNEGRPRIIGDIEPLAQAVVNILLPGNAGGDALAALLCGEENFSGRMPYTYPRHINALHTYDYKVSEHREMMEGSYNYDAVMDVQWPFGHGLSYTDFAYSDLKVLGPAEFRAGDELHFSVAVTNTGSRSGKEAVLLYSSDLVASLIPDVKRLRAFDKIELAPGETKTVEFRIPADELAFVGDDNRWRLEAGDFRISCGGLAVLLHCTQTKIWDTPNR